jgi:hypothetical protein
VDISSIESTPAGWVAAGAARIERCEHGYCRTCGRVFELARREIPLQYPSLTCTTCDRQGRVEFHVTAIRRGEDEIEFQARGECQECRGRKSFTKVLRGLLDVLSIELGPGGITVKKAAGSPAA